MFVSQLTSYLTGLKLFFLLNYFIHFVFYFALLLFIVISIGYCCLNLQCLTYFGARPISY